MLLGNLPRSALILDQATHSQINHWLCSLIFRASRLRVSERESERDALAISPFSGLNLLYSYSFRTSKSFLWFKEPKSLLLRSSICSVLASSKQLRRVKSISDESRAIFTIKRNVRLVLFDGEMCFCGISSSLASCNHEHTHTLFI